MSKKQNKASLYRAANEQYLQQKSQEVGVIALKSGILMRKLKEGSSRKCPQLNSIVFVHYTGRLIDGTVFGTTDGQDLPACFRVRELIVG